MKITTENKNILDKDQEIELLKNNLSLLKHILNKMPGHVMWKNISGQYLGCNDNHAKMFNLKSADDIIGKTNIELAAKFKQLESSEQLRELAKNDPEITKIIESLRIAEKRDQEVITTKKELTIEEYGFNTKHEDAIYLSKKLPLIINDKVIGLLGISFDISDRKKMEQDLKEAKDKAEAADRSKSEFIANMSHDIKTPLASIIGLAELLNQRLDGEELKFSQAMLTSSQHLLQFFNNCLEVFKLESNELSLPIESFDINQLVNEVKEIFQPILNQKPISLNIQTHSNQPFYITSSRIGIYRICLNLISNAIKFTEKGSITISTDHKTTNGTNFLMIKVHDTGIGIPTNKKDYVFERFTRLVPSYKGTYDGSGIGLYIVKKFVESLKGSIEIESTVGVGSCFKVSIPFKPANETNTELSCTLPQHNEPITEQANITKIKTISNPIIAQDKNPSTRILLVEDNLVVQQIQVALLKSLGHEVDIAKSGEEALEHFEPNRYRIILMDIGLPGIQGDLTAKLLRKMEHEHTQKSIIIALTAHITHEMQEQCYKHGIDEVISKPLSQEQAKTLLEKYIPSEE